MAPDTSFKFNADYTVAIKIVLMQHDACYEDDNEMHPESQHQFVPYNRSQLS